MLLIYPARPTVYLATVSLAAGTRAGLLLCCSLLAQPKKEEAHTHELKVEEEHTGRFKAAHTLVPFLCFFSQCK